MKNNNKRTFSVNRADSEYRRIELFINEVRFSILFLFFVICIILVVTDTSLPLWAILFIGVVLYSTPSILRIFLYKIFHLNMKGFIDDEKK